MKARDILVPTIVAGLIFAGFFKALPALGTLPVDPALPLAVLVGLGVVGYALAQATSIRFGRPVAGTVVVVAFGWLHPATSGYAFSKRTFALAITLLAIVAVLLLVRSATRQRVWVWLHVVVGVALIALSTTNDVGRLGANTIAAGRASGVALVVLVVLITTGGLRHPLARVAAVVVAAWLAFSLLETGSRGPVLAAAIAIVVASALAPGRGRLVRVPLSLVAVWLGWLLLGASTGAGADRISVSLSGEASTTQTREGLWSAAVAAIPAHPSGVGWGNFWQVLQPGQMLASGYRQYPHNAILEVTIEAGWLAGALVVAFLLLGLNRLRRAATTSYATAPFAIALFFVINAMVSGDINDNRVMWPAVAMGWVVATGGARPDQGAISPIKRMAASSALS